MEVRRKEEAHCAVREGGPDPDSAGWEGECEFCADGGDCASGAGCGVYAGVRWGKGEAGEWLAVLGGEGREEEIIIVVDGDIRRQGGGGCCGGEKEEGEED